MRGLRGLSVLTLEIRSRLARRASGVRSRSCRISSAHDARRDLQLVHLQGFDTADLKERQSAARGAKYELGWGQTMVPALFFGVKRHCLLGRFFVLTAREWISPDLAPGPHLFSDANQSDGLGAVAGVTINRDQRTRRS